MYISQRKVLGKANALTWRFLLIVCRRSTFLEDMAKYASQRNATLQLLVVQRSKTQKLLTKVMIAEVIRITTSTCTHT